MSALLDSLLAGHDDAASRAILDAGLPGPRSEAWKYTPLRAFERRMFSPAQPIEVHAGWIEGIPAPRIVFVNGVFDAGLSDIADLPQGLDIVHGCGRGSAVRIETDANAWHPAGDDVFANLNAELAKDGAHIEVSAVIDKPLHLVTLNLLDGEDRAIHLHHAITLSGGAGLTLV